MNVWLINSSEPLPTDSSTTRLMRMGILARHLLAHGHRVRWWSATFWHAAKTHRFGKDTSLDVEPGYSIELIHGPGYKSNVSMRRLIDHRFIAKRFEELASNHQSPDLILCSLPTVDLGEAAVALGRRLDIPVVLDIRDMWPDVFANLAPRWCQPLAKAALIPLERKCRRACKGAFAITGHAPGFVQWGVGKAGRPKRQLDRYFPFGYVESTPDEAELARARAYWRDVLGDRIDRPIACFFGAVSRQFQFDSVIQAARLLKDDEITFVLCGIGDRLEELRTNASDLSNVMLPGWIQRPEIRELMRLSFIGLAPYRDTLDFQLSIPNKSIEYFSGGLPIATSLSRGTLVEMLTEHQCGFQFGGDPAKLAKRLVELKNSPEQLEKMSAAAKGLYRDRFTSDKVYSGMVEYLESVSQAASIDSATVAAGCDHEVESCG